MNEYLQKVKRMNSIVRVRKIQYDKEFFELTQIKIDKQNLLNKLQEYQNMYCERVNESNNERMSGNRNRLDLLEKEIERIKSEWLSTLSQIKELDAKEQYQEEQVRIADRNLKSIEKLVEIYQEESYLYERHEDQKIMDEIGIRRFNS